MRELNRKNLTKFLKRVRRNKKLPSEMEEVSPSKILENFDSMSTSQDYYSQCTPSPDKFKKAVMHDEPPIDLDM